MQAVQSGCGAVDRGCRLESARKWSYPTTRCVPATCRGRCKARFSASQLGETSPPFGSIEDGVRVLMMCGRDDPQSDSGPSFDQLMGQMEEDRINKRAQIYLRDLRRDAIIEYN